MRLYDEIFKNADGAALTKCTIVPDGGGYFEGVKAVGDFSPQRIVIAFPKSEIEITGEGLSIKKYCDGDLQISGKIYGFRTLGKDADSPPEPR